MLNKVQESEMNSKKITCINLFLSSDIVSIDDVVKETGISRSSVQRYLNDEDFIVNHFSRKQYLFIKDKLVKSKKLGLAKGGINSQKNNIQIRDKQGHYKGNYHR